MEYLLTVIVPREGILKRKKITRAFSKKDEFLESANMQIKEGYVLEDITSRENDIIITLEKTETVE